MKKLLSAILVLVMVLSLCACKSEEAKNAEELINAIGDVSLTSESAITAAENAYNALSEEDKASIENLDVLTAARNSYDVIYVSAQIDAIGEVTLDSEAAINTAEAAYSALSDENKAQVTNASALTDARAAYDAAVHHEEVRLSILGSWLNEAVGDNAHSKIMEDTDHYSNHFEYLDTDGLNQNAPANCFQILEDGSVAIEDTPVGTWELSEDAATVTITSNDDTVEPFALSILEEGGFTKLVGALFNSKPFGYARAEDYEAAFAEKFVVAELTSDNVRDYIGDPVDLGSADSPAGTMQHCQVFPSQAYDDGLVYLGCSCHVQLVGTHNGKSITIDSTFPVICGWFENVVATGIGDSARGETYYIKAEYVAENYIDEEGYRTLVLTNGVTLRFDGYGEEYDIFWSLVDANYEDYIY